MKKIILSIPEFKSWDEARNVLRQTIEQVILVMNQQMQGKQLDGQGLTVVNVQDPLLPSDAATKGYVDKQGGGQRGPSPLDQIISIDGSGVSVEGDINTEGVFTIAGVQVVGPQLAAVTPVSGIAGGVYNAGVATLINDHTIAINTIISRLQTTGITA